MYKSNIIGQNLINILENFSFSSMLDRFWRCKMKNNYLQNMIVLKNLPSNLVEEAIVVLKQNKKAKNINI